jgi:putative two-component system response regulator
MPFAPGTSALEPTSILVVDDEPLLRNVVCTLLGREGYVCGQASGVREALAILDREPYGLVLCDLEMPGERGIDLVKALHPRMPHVAVVIVSGRNDMSIITDCLEQGAYGYVFKPFQVREILVQIRGALRRQRLELDAQDREGELNRRVLEQTKVIRESREEVALRWAGTRRPSSPSASPRPCTTSARSACPTRCCRSTAPWTTRNGWSCGATPTSARPC